MSNSTFAAYGAAMEKLTPLGVIELPRGQAEPTFIFPYCFGPSNQ